MPGTSSTRAARKLDSPSRLIQAAIVAEFSWDCKHMIL